MPGPTAPVMSQIPGFEKLQDIMQQAGQLEERVAYERPSGEH